MKHKWVDSLLWNMKAYRCERCSLYIVDAEMAPAFQNSKPVRWQASNVLHVSFKKMISKRAVIQYAEDEPNKSCSKNPGVEWADE